MRKSVFSIVTLALLGAGSSALAADTAGTVKSIDTAKSTITLADGKTYPVERVVDLTKFKVGEKLDLAILGSANPEVLDARPAA